jgi:hypothetical protein
MSALFFAVTAEAEIARPGSSIPAGSSAVCQTTPQDMTDNELERHIRDCGGQMLLAMARYERYGDFADRGDADRWLALQNAAIRARSPEMVAKLEKERGLA